MKNIDELSEAIENKAKFEVIEKNEYVDAGFTISECRIISINVIHQEGFDARMSIKYIKDDDNTYNMNFSIYEEDFYDQDFDSVLIDVNKKFKIKK